MAFPSVRVITRSAMRTASRGLVKALEADSPADADWLPMLPFPGFPLREKTTYAAVLTDGAGALWADIPTLPLYRQQRTLIVAKKMSGVSENPTRWGAGWNMDRWVLSE